VSLVLVPGSTDDAAVPQQVVVSRPQQTQPAPDRRGSTGRPHPRPTATSSPSPTATPTPDDHSTDEPTVVVSPSREVESESPEDRHESGDDRAGDR
jgi:hypothetical protein